MLIIDNQLFPPVDFIKALIKGKHVKIEACDYFRKMSFRNRYIIAGANGLINLTIPISGGREQKLLITEVRINNSIDWQIKHWRAISSSYSKAPYFDFYASSIRSLIFTQEVSLFKLSLSILFSFCSLLNISAGISLTEEYLTYDNKDDFRNKLLPRSFQDNKINWQPKYSQVFEDRLGFQPNLSILDLLFCEGPNSVNLLERSL